MMNYDQSYQSLEVSLVTSDDQSYQSLEVSLVISDDQSYQSLEVSLVIFRGWEAGVFLRELSTQPPYYWETVGMKAMVLFEGF